MSAVRSVSYLWLASMLAAGLALLTQMLLARAVSPADYGLYAASVTVAAMVAPLAGVGMPGYLLKVFGAEGPAATRWVRAAVRAMVPALGLGMLASALYACLIRPGAADRLLGLALAPMVLSYVGAELLLARYQIENRSLSQSVWTVLPNLMRLLVALATWALHWPVTWAATGIGAASLVTGALAIVLGGRTPWRLPVGAPTALVGAGGPAETGGLVKEALPFALSQFVFLAYAQGAVLLLEALQGSRSAGVYSLTVAILTAVYLIPTVVSQRYLLSRFHRWSVHEPDRFRRVYQASCGLLLALGGLLGIGVSLLSPWAVDLIFGPAYRDVGAMLVMCSLCVPARFLAAVLGTALTTGDNIGHRLLAQVVVAAVTLLLSAWAIQRWGLVGAAAAAAGGEWLLALAYLQGCTRHVFGSAAWHGWNLRVSELRGGS